MAHDELWTLQRLLVGINLTYQQVCWSGAADVKRQVSLLYIVLPCCQMGSIDDESQTQVKVRTNLSFTSSLRGACIHLRLLACTSHFLS